MISRPRGQRSPEEEIAVAPAIAMDFANAEDRGREQSGDVHGLINMFQATLGESIRIRTIRQVVGDNSELGPKGAIVETTERDQELAKRPSPRRISHWYFGEGVSPAVVVFEENLAQKIPEGMTIIDRDGVEIPRPGVSTIIKEDLGALHHQMLFDFSGLPVAALAKTGMSPEEIWQFLEENELNWKGVGHFF